MEIDLDEIDAEKMEEYGWKVKMNHEFEEKRNQNFKPRIHQLPQLMGMLSRYLIWYTKIRLQKRKPFIDGIKTLPLQQIYGVPLGGIGSGTIGRGFRGEFCRFQLLPGYYEHHVVTADQFIVCIRRNGETVYQQVLSPLTPKKLKAWKWGFDDSQAHYRGLYPRAWYSYNIPEQNVQLVCRQISPIIPNNYKDSSLPVGVFHWSVHNRNTEPVEVSIVLSFKNGTGSQKDKHGGCWTEPFTETCDGTIAKGIFLHQKLRNTDCTLAISAAQEEGVRVTHLLNFDPNGTGEELWQDLWEDGCLKSGRNTSNPTLRGQEIACAVCCQIEVNAGKTNDLKLCLAWDMPKITFRAGEMTHKRWYSRWFNSDAPLGGVLCAYALQNYVIWEKEIDNWQNPILQDLNLPAWYKSALFNELYFISDGGSVWVEMPPLVDGMQIQPGDVRYDYGRFAYLEGHEYRMFNTYDVHFYASFALIMLWPKLQLSLQYDMRDVALREDLRTVKFIMNGKIGSRKVPFSIPHDIGDPEEDPWLNVNSYLIHDTSQWKDLNLKFVLQVYRDYIFTTDEQYLQNMWPLVKELINKSIEWDIDGDGLIENSGSADQTYDSWVMKGASSYCGGLWLASLHVASIMANLMNSPEDEKKYEDILNRGKKAYEEKLWTGSYYKFDSSTSTHSNSIMSDQLCGHWYLKTCRITDEVFPKENVQKALRTIYENNVLKFKNGSMGAVNGMMPNGMIDTYAVQSEEVWIGVTYALAATMIHEGMLEEGLCTARGMYTSVYDRLGMAFQTPEALFSENHYRSIGYMRPLSIWAIQLALQDKKEKQSVN